MSVGPTEIIVILIVALLIFGPKQLPQMGRNLGRGMREFRRAAASARSELGLDEVAKEVNQVTDEMKSAVGELTGGAELTSAISEVKASVDPRTFATVPKPAPEPSGGEAAASTAAEAPQGKADGSGGAPASAYLWRPFTTRCTSSSGLACSARSPSAASAPTSTPTPRTTITT